MTVNVTNLLVITTFFISISDSLPKTSYVKAIDLWLIMNLLIPFLMIILESILNILHKEQEDGSARRIQVRPTNDKNKGKDVQSVNGRVVRLLQLFTRFGLPAFYILFCICFFVYGMLQ